MTAKEIHAVTGAFGYSGKYIARRLLRCGQSVVTLTNSPQRPHPFGKQIRAFPFNFEDVAALRASLEGVAVLYNTYWVRFNHQAFQHATAVRNTLRLFEAAAEARVERVVHISITNPALDSPLEYFRGKAALEQALAESGLSYAIFRPAVLFGEEDILINNIAYLLRKLPLFGIFGDGHYRLQPIFVDDLARLAVEQGALHDNAVINAIGPETFTYRELVEAIAAAIDVRRPIISVPPWLGFEVGRVLSWALNDVLITREEIEGLMAGLLYVDAPPAGVTSLTSWAASHGDSLGRQYHSELARRSDRSAAFGAHRSPASAVPG